MLGYLLFTDSNQLLLVYGDREMRRHLITKQAEFAQDLSTSGYSDLTTSPEPSDDTRSGDKVKDPYDLQSLTQYFLPLFALYRAKRECDQDSYQQINCGQQRFMFTRLPNDFVLLTISRKSTHTFNTVRFYSAMFLRLTGFCFGSILSCADEQEGSQLSGFFNSKDGTRLFSRLIGRTLADPDSWMQQTAAGCLDLAAAAREHDNQALQSMMNRLTEHYQVYLGAEACLLIRDRHLLGLHYATATRETGEWLSPDDLQLIVISQSTDSYYRPELKQKLKPKCMQVWLRQKSGTSGSARTLWDVFRYEVGERTEFVCLTPADYSSVIDSADLLQNTMNEMIIQYRPRSNADFETLIQKTDQIIGDICRSFYQHSLADSTELTSNFGGNDAASSLSGKWWTIRGEIHNNANSLTNSGSYGKDDKNRASVKTTAETITPQVEAKIRNLLRATSSLILTLTNRSSMNCKKFRVPMFTTCWNRLHTWNANGTFQQSIIELLPVMSLRPDLFMEPIVNTSIDAQQFTLLCTDQRVGMSSSTQNPRDRRIRLQALASSVHLYGELSVVRSTEALLVAVSQNHNRYNKQQSSTNSNWWRKRVTKPAEADFDQLKRPFLLMVMFDESINEQLAMKQAKTLAVHISELLKASNVEKWMKYFTN